MCVVVGGAGRGTGNFTGAGELIAQGRCDRAGRNGLPALGTVPISVDLESRKG